MRLGHSLKARLRKDELAVGVFVQMRTAAVVEILGRTGFDFLVLDMEHGSLDLQDAEELIRASDVTGITPIVRVPRNDANAILKVLEMGAKGILAPRVDSAEEARNIVQAAKYAPIGARGIAFLSRAAGYFAEDPKAYFREANAETLVITQIESVEGARNAAEVCSVDGVDALFIGPYDLSQSMGYPGEVKRPVVEETMSQSIRAICEHGCVAGIYAGPEDAARWVNEGVRMLACSVDVLLFHERCQALFGELNGALRGQAAVDQ